MSEVEPNTQSFLNALGGTNATRAELEHLLTAGFDPNRTLPDVYGVVQTPAGIAAAHPNPELLQALLEHGADPNQASPDGTTPYLRARTPAHLDLLLKHGARYPAPTAASETPLRNAYRSGDLERIHHLLERGAPREDLEVGPVHWAIITRSLQTTPELSGLEDRDFLGWTPLMLALRMGEIQAARTLAAAGANPNATDPHGNSGLHLAVRAGNLLAVRAAVEFMVYVGIQNSDSETAFQLAQRLGELAIADYLAKSLETPAPDYDPLEHYLRSAEDAWEVHHQILEALPEAAREDLWGDASRPTQRLFGRSNPELFTSESEREENPRFWNRLIARKPESPSPWSPDRYGQTITALPNGRTLHIGGASGDSYFPEFCIYNDVIVCEPGFAPRLYLYPREVFAPADFHSATLVGDWIYIIGGLGYPDERGETRCPVYRLHLPSLQIEKLETTGEDPGRIFRHEAGRITETQILVRNGFLATDRPPFNQRHTTGIFDTESLRWSRAE